MAFLFDILTDDNDFLPLQYNIKLKNNNNTYLLVTKLIVSSFSCIYLLSRVPFVASCFFEKIQVW